MLNLQQVVAVLAERLPGERRVALVPSDVRRLRSLFTVSVESGAGVEAGFSDDAYVSAGAEVGDRASTLAFADAVVCIHTPNDAAMLASHTVLFSLGPQVPSDAAKLTTHLRLDRMPRNGSTLAMDVLASQATIAGYAAVIEGARASDCLMPMLTTAAGNISPQKMIALGTGVVGLQAIATARRLGADAHGFDVRYDGREPVESLGARFLHPIDNWPHVEGPGNTAPDSRMSGFLKRRSLASLLVDMRLIVTSAQRQDKSAPLLIDDLTLAELAPGTVIVDVAANIGGNTSVTRANETVKVGGVTVIGETNLPNLFPTDASRLLSGTIRALLTYLVGSDGRLRIDKHDRVVAALLSPATT